jgi:hypothetical protein
MLGMQVVEIQCFADWFALRYKRYTLNGDEHVKMLTVIKVVRKRTKDEINVKIK